MELIETKNKNGVVYRYAIDGDRPIWDAADGRWTTDSQQRNVEGTSESIATIFVNNWKKNF
jgi:hypothetical protein